MSQESNPNAPLLKAVLILQILTLSLFGWTHFTDSSLRAEQKMQLEEYRAKQLEYEKISKEYQSQMDNYKAQLADWQKGYAAYTNNMSPAMKP
jgi:hypothetical protein